jgi:hypothetical protein
MMRKALSVLMALVVSATMALPTHAKPMVLDRETGHHKDMSYEAPSDEGLSWEEKTRLFGGETATATVVSALRTSRLV